MGYKRRKKLYRRIVRSLRRQGFHVRRGIVTPPSDLTKDKIRQLHTVAVDHKRQVARPALWPIEDALLGNIASGMDINPDAIRPRLVEVTSGSKEELLFRYCSLHWSVPVSTGYGRRLRFIVVDDQNDKVMGILGLGDPVYSLAGRDRWIGWDSDARLRGLQHVMDAFALGAVPPYSFLLCGKLIAMLAASTEVRDAFRRKYRGAVTRIRRRVLDGRLALVTTASALGRSSLYNRISFGGQRLFHHVGFTEGSGEFHFANGTYAALKDYAQRHCEPSQRRARWGEGFRNRRELIRKCLPLLGISRGWTYHGIKRELFAVPLARNTREFLRGEHVRLQWHGHTAQDLFQSFRERWLFKRDATDARFRDWRAEEWRFWPSRNGHTS